MNDKDQQVPLNICTPIVKLGCIYRNSSSEERRIYFLAKHRNGFCFIKINKFRDSWQN